MTTLPFTDWMGSTTTATARWFSASKLCRGQPRVGLFCNPKHHLHPRCMGQDIIQLIQHRLQTIETSGAHLDGLLTCIIAQSSTHACSLCSLNTATSKDISLTACGSAPRCSLQKEVLQGHCKGPSAPAACLCPRPTASSQSRGGCGTSRQPFLACGNPRQAVCRQSDLCTAICSGLHTTGMCVCVTTWSGLLTQIRATWCTLLHAHRLQAHSVKTFS